MYKLIVDVMKNNLQLNKPSRVEIQTEFKIGDVIEMNYDVPKGPLKPGIFKVTNIICNMLVFPHENMLELDSIDNTYDSLYPNKKTILIFEEVVRDRIISLNNNKMNSFTIVRYRNEFVSLEDDGERLRVIDSDGTYISYLCDINDLSKDDVHIRIGEFIQAVDCRFARVIALYLQTIIGDDDIIDIISGGNLVATKEKYGEDFVNRIGDVFLIIAE